MTNIIKSRLRERPAAGSFEFQVSLMQRSYHCNSIYSSQAESAQRILPIFFLLFLKGTQHRQMITYSKKKHMHFISSFILNLWYIGKLDVSVCHV